MRSFPSARIAAGGPARTTTRPLSRMRSRVRRLQKAANGYEQPMFISDRPALAPIPPGWEQPIRDWEMHLRSQGLRYRTIDTRVRHVRRLAREVTAPTPSTLCSSALVDWSGTKNWAPETRHSHHASIRLFLRWYAEYAHCDTLAELPSIRRRVPPPRPIPDDALLDGLKDKPLRVRVILRLASELGLRASEICALHNRDISRDGGGWALRVHGKGGRIRCLPVSQSLAADIRQLQSDHDSPWLFPGRIDGHLSARYISKIGARVLPGEWTLHTLRHRFATTAYKHCKDLLAIRQALGHSSIQTTTRYTDFDPTQLTHIIEATKLNDADDTRKERP